jgi:hypothetical protein
VTLKAVLSFSVFITASREHISSVSRDVRCSMAARGPVSVCVCVCVNRYWCNEINA